MRYTVVVVEDNGDMPSVWGIQTPDGNILSIDEAAAMLNELADMLAESQMNESERAQAAQLIGRANEAQRKLIIYRGDQRVRNALQDTINIALTDALALIIAAQGSTDAT